MKDRQNVEIDRYVPDFRERRRKQSRRRLITYLCILFSLLAIIWYFQSEYSLVGEVKISGNDRISEAWIMEATDNFDDISMWSAPFDDQAQAIQDHPAVSEVNLERDWPRTLHLHITEYDTAGFIPFDDTDTFQPLLQNGAVLTSDEFRISNAPGPIIRQMDSHPRLDELAHELHQLDEAVNRRISEIVHEPDIDENHLTLYMTDGFTVHTVITNFAEYMHPYPAVAVQLDPDEDGILHMRMTPYYQTADEEEEEIEIEE